METDAAFAAAAALVAMAFAATTHERWLDRRDRHLLAWTVALLLFAAAAAALWAGASFGWDGPTFRLFFALGAVANVPVLALGSIYLSFPRALADRIAMTTCCLVAYGCGVVMASPLTNPVPADALPRGADVFGAGPRIAAAVSSSAAAVVIVVLSVRSIWRAARIGDRRRVGANAAILLGTVILSTGGLFNSLASEMTAFALSLLVGVSALFVGFLVASSRVHGGARDAVTRRLDDWLVPFDAS